MTITKTDPARLPQWKGRAVPWITRWTGERSTSPFRPTIRNGLLAIEYEDGNENRERSGALWQRESLSRRGEPEFAMISTYRQRAAMTRGRCQVCGDKIEETPIRWLMPLDGIKHIDDSDITMSAPTCSGCIELALELCPHLKRKGYHILKVLDYEAWGVYGEFLMLGEQGPVRGQSYMGYEVDHPQGFSWHAVLAKQLVVRLTKYTIEETVRL